MPGEEEVFLDCPYCGARISVLVDTSVAAQCYVEDCEVCCRPLQVAYTVSDDGVSLQARRGDD